ncbi:MAG: hypothetical protein KIT22_15040, partial [Verrucomicrobiae bacterium]|nr:hypothetical protein [Verrucomicrobiae bacterium]
MTRFPLFLTGFAAATGISLGELPKTSADLFRLDRIWTATLSLSAEAWENLQPEESQGPGFPFGGPGGPGRPGGPGGGPTAFGPGNFLAGGFVAALDQDKNGELSAAEFHGGFARWFGEWDAKKQGALSGDEVRDGFNKVLAGPPPGGGPGGGPGPGPTPNAGPGAGPGPGGPGFGLQGPAGKRNGLSAMRGIDFE